MTRSSAPGAFSARWQWQRGRPWERRPSHGITHRRPGARPRRRDASRNLRPSTRAPAWLSLRQCNSSHGPPWVRTSADTGTTWPCSAPLRTNFSRGSRNPAYTWCSRSRLEGRTIHPSCIHRHHDNPARIVAVGSQSKRRAGRTSARRTRRSTCTRQSTHSRKAWVRTHTLPGNCLGSERTRSPSRHLTYASKQRQQRHPSILR